MADVAFPDLRISISDSESESLYRFEGEINENFQLSEVPIANSPRIILDLYGIDSFNSVGIREWIHFIKKISQNSQIIFINCSVPTVDQLNMVPESQGTANIESFFAPYYCDCGQEDNLLIQRSLHENLLATGKAPEFDCKNCGKKMEFDALEDSYFQFIAPSLKVG